MLKKSELEASTKVLRIQNLPYDTDEMVYTLTAELLALILNLTPHEVTQEIDHAYRQHTTYTRKNKLTPEILVTLIYRFVRDSILKEIQDKERNIILILKEIPWQVCQQCKEY